MNALPTLARQSTGVEVVPIAIARLIWHAVRLPIFALLTLLEPVVRGIFSLAMLLGILAATVFELSAAGAHFDFLETFALSLGFGAALFVYYGLLALVSR